MFRRKTKNKGSTQRLFEKRMVEIEELNERQMITNSQDLILTTAAAVEAGIASYESYKKEFFE